jgi:ABC-type multidrug transport system fused ATPase/permease subunit
VPDELYEKIEGGPLKRIRIFLKQHHLRWEIAQQKYWAQRSPKLGIPVTDNGTVVRFIAKLIRTRKGVVTAMILANVVAAVAGLIAPSMLGGLVDYVSSTTHPDAMAHVSRTCLIVIGVIVAQAAFNMLARALSAVFGQDMVAESREHVIRSVLKLPVSTVEAASTGDLVTRVTRDVATMSGGVRWALPRFVIAAVTVGATAVAMVLNSWLLALPLVFTAGLLAVATRRYLRFGTIGFVAESISYGQINSSLTETVEGARTVEALNLQANRVFATDDDIEVAGQRETFTAMLRSELFVEVGFAYRLPLVFALIIGGWGYGQGLVTIGQITAATLYLQQLVSPIELMIMTLNWVQRGIASASRLLGIAAVPPDRETSGEEPADEHLVATDLYFAYREGHDVLHGVSLDLTPGERLAVVGPSGGGKSTLGRLLAGINAPRSGTVRVGGANVMGLPLDKLRTEVALVTQEHHVFVGTIRDNIVLAREATATDEQTWEALATVEAADWVRKLPKGLDTMIGSGHHQLTPAQAQQIALARLVLADPHTLVLDEATSLIDPTTARHVEGAMSALLTGRTVVAIAHRLHTAHDAHRIAVVIDGRIVEYGSHDDLLATGGEYARLWDAWTN